MPHEVTARVLWLVPPLLFTAGLGITQPSDNDSFSYRADPELFVDARVGYPIDNNAAGLRLRGSHARITWGDSLAPPPYDAFVDQFELYTLDAGAFGEHSTRYLTFMAWLGVHTARVRAKYHHYTYDDSATFSYRETFYTGPAVAGGIAFGINVYNHDRYKVTVYVEKAFTGHIFMTDKSLEDDSYTYDPLSLGVAARF